MRVLARLVMVVAAVLLVSPLQDNLLREAFKAEKKKCRKFHTLGEGG